MKLINMPIIVDRRGRAILIQWVPFMTYIIATSFIAMKKIEQLQKNISFVLPRTEPTYYFLYIV